MGAPNGCQDGPRTNHITQHFLCVARPGLPLPRVIVSSGTYWYLSPTHS
ncbi:hypothetical protein HMPREF3214_01665 [Alloscardovia omnicolens]|nr:hypothetical protein HMPREF3214_01665 [Alloscardovia omnicolens]